MSIQTICGEGLNPYICLVNLECHVLGFLTAVKVSFYQSTSIRSKGVIGVRNVRVAQYSCTDLILIWIFYQIIFCIINFTSKMP